MWLIINSSTRTCLGRQPFVWLLCGFYDIGSTSFKIIVLESYRFRVRIPSSGIGCGTSVVIRYCCSCPSATRASNGIVGRIRGWVEAFRLDSKGLVRIGYRNFK